MNTDDDPLHNSIVPVAAAIQLCLQQNLLLPALALLYVALDAVGARYAGVPATRATFEAWATEFLLPQLEFSGSAADLYAARCGVLHDLKPASRLSTKGTVKRVGHRYGRPTGPDAEALAERAAAHGVPLLDIEDLWLAFVRGVDVMMRRASTDPRLAARLRAARRGDFVDVRLP